MPPSETARPPQADEPASASSRRASGGLLTRCAQAFRFGTLKVRIAAIYSGLLVGAISVFVLLDRVARTVDPIHFPGSSLARENAPMLAAGFAVVGLLLVAATSFIVARTVTRPLAELARATRSLAKGRSARVVVGKGDEIGLLAESFNAMVDAIERRERQMTHVALHDALTGLPNRKFFNEQLDLTLHRRRPGTRVLVAYVDLDDFKIVNDTLGHGAGDRLLCDVAEKLQTELADAVIARLGGDEFAVMFQDLPAETNFAALATRLQGCFGQSVVLDGRKAQVSASIGIAVGPEDGIDGPTLLRNADLALYRAKEQGKAHHHFFEQSLDEQAQRRRMLEQDLRVAIREGGFELRFQPLYSLSEERLTAFEALVRWPHATLGMISPTEFIPLAEETGLIMQIGEWVMREACSQATNWPQELSVAVNLSPRQFLTPALPNMVVQALAISGLPPERLELEITEAVFEANTEKTLETLHALQALGVRIALDDFGTGYSSLSYLRAFPFDKLKIDNAFVRDLARGGNAHAVIRAITTLADALGMETLAEGVEEPGQLAVLRAEGCRQIQGYILSRPLGGTQVPSFISELSARPQTMLLRA